jgi:3'-phosphoadenosine 5'-phosphosulfate synthase
MKYDGKNEVKWNEKDRMYEGENLYIVGREKEGLKKKERDLKCDIYEEKNGDRVMRMDNGMNKMEIIKFRVEDYDKKKKKMDFFQKNRKQHFQLI